MEQGKRQLKVSSLLQSELASVFRDKFRELIASSLVTVTMVRVTADLSLARVYLSVYGPNQAESKETVVHKLRQAKSAIRGELGHRIRNQLRVVPDLEFYLDDSLDYAEHIEKLLKEHTPSSK
ncbi:MAG: 30S ribosome-binding factor RbfA [Sphingomonadales bacterium]|nr:30S ribosome-binding factor RbfA [Sphingomonadales bacterium]MBM3931465.1 30S ribosome-binding factor RbfA [Sphingomonadales bacterium]